MDQIDGRIDRPQGMNGKEFTVRLIDVLRWPAAFVAAVLILKEPLAGLLRAITGAVSG